MIKKLITTTLISSIILFSAISSSNAFAKIKNSSYKAVMITGTGGLGDQSFNDDAYSGLLLAHFDYGIRVTSFTSIKTKDFATNLIKAGGDGYDFILGSSFLMTDDIKSVAEKYPKSQFILLDSYIKNNKLKNLSTISFKVGESAYLAGVLAGNLTSKYSNISSKLNNKKILGIIIGKDIPPVEEYAAGYIAGILSVDPTIKIIIRNIKTFSSKYHGRKATEYLISRGVDIILPIAGASGLGAIESAKANNVFAIGVDKDQNSKAKKTVLTSIQKNISIAVKKTVKMSMNGKMINKNSVFGLKNGGVSLSSYHSLKTLIPKEVISQINIAKQNIIKGKIHIPLTIKQALSKK